MKRIVGLSAMTGCQKYNYNPSMAATIDTIGFSAIGQAYVYAIVDTTTHNPQLVTITGKTTVYTPGTAFQPSIILVVPNIIGNYVITANDTTKRAMVYTSATGSLGTAAVSGQINVLNINGGKIQGNFTLTCADGTTVTNGQYIAVESFE